MSAQRTIRLALFVLAGASLLACGSSTHGQRFTESMVLGGYEVDPDTLNAGQVGYTRYCYACHGTKGDGRGPASVGLRPPPRDMRLASYKFTRTIDGLPHDEDLMALVQHGLKGTAMLAWDVPEETLYDILQYIKTFSPEGTGWRDEMNDLGDRVLPTKDPWITGSRDVSAYGVRSWARAEQARRQAAEDLVVARGEKLYHAYQCWSCHAAFLPKREISKASEEIKGQVISKFRPYLYLSEPKVSSAYTVAQPHSSECTDPADCRPGEVCVIGRCELKLKIKPPDFTMDPIRAGSSVEGIYRTISAGIPGSGMPQWKGSVDDKDIWAVAHYVHKLASLRGTPKAWEMKQRLMGGTIPKP